VNNDEARKILAGLGVSFRELFAAHHDIAFRDARAAVATLGQTLRLDETAAGYFRKHLQEAKSAGAKELTLHEAIAALRVGVIAAEKVGIEPEVVSSVPAATELEFEGLRNLIDAAATSH